MAPGRRPGFLCNVERRQQRRGGRIWADRFHLGLHRERRCLVPAFQSGYFSKRVGIIFKTALPFRTLEAHSCASKHWAAPPCLEDHAPRVTEDRPQQSQDPSLHQELGAGLAGKAQNKLTCSFLFFLSLQESRLVVPQCSLAFWSQILFCFPHHPAPTYHPLSWIKASLVRKGPGEGGSGSDQHPLHPHPLPPAEPTQQTLSPLGQTPQGK